MKTFRRIIAEVAQPSSEDELNFKEKHVIDHILDPNSEEEQFTADDIKKFKNRADYKKGEDMAVYEGITLARRDLPGQEDDDPYNDGVRDMIDAQLKYRRHAQIKNKIIDEGAKFVLPEEILATEKNAFFTAAANAHKAGKSHFMFSGKKYPVTMSKDAAKTFSGKGKNLEEASPLAASNKKLDTNIKRAEKSDADAFLFDGSRKATTKGSQTANMDEAKMSPAQMKKREEIVMSMKKNASDLKKRYGKDWEGVMYAIATKQAMNEETLTNDDWEKDSAKVKKSKDPKFVSKMIEKWGSRGSAWLNHPALVESMDPVGQEDDDINNDGKVDKSDAYLRARRNAIARKLQQEGLMDVVQPVGGEYGDEERSHVAYKKKNKSSPDHRGEPIEVKESDLHEVSKKMLGQYIKAAGPDRERLMKRAKETSQLGHEFKKDGDAKKAQELFYKAGGDVLKAANRRAGINKAVEKLTKEEVERIDEVSKQTLKSYVKKAEKSYDSELNKAAKAGREMDRARKTNPGNDDVHAMYRNQFLKHASKSEKRLRGLIKADEKLAKEDVSLANPKSGMRVYAGKTKKSEIAEAFEEGIFHFDNGSKTRLISEHALVLNQLFDMLDESNRDKMMAIATSCDAGLKEVVRFAKEVL